MIRASWPGSTPAVAVTERKAASTPSCGAWGVVGIFAVKRRSPTSRATSVNVPPMSTPTLTVGEGVTRERSSQCLRQLNRLVAQEGGDPRIALEVREILRRRQLRLVARGVHHAEKSERLAPSGAGIGPRPVADGGG